MKSPVERVIFLFSVRRSLGRILFVTGAITVGSLGHGQDSFADDVRRSKSAATTNGIPAPSPKPQPPLPSPPSPPRPVPPPAAVDPRFAQAAKAESEDFSVAPVESLHAEPFHAPTPTSIPGAQVISTQALAAMYEKNAGNFIVFDVLGGPQGLPGAQNALPAARGTSFNDQTQRDFGNYLQQVTRGNKDVPLVFYCQSAHCWMSYNAALRAVRLGCTRVYWYRGGIEAWQAAGLPLQGRQP